MFYTKNKLKEGSINAKIIKADGTIVELGDIVYYNKNIFKMMTWRVKRWLITLR